MGKMGFYVDMNVCIGCRTCQVACKDRNNLKIGTLFRAVSTYENGKFPKPGYFHLTAACNHCTNPKCVEVCPTDSMYIADDGTVQHNYDTCIGCGSCVAECPYGAPKFVVENEKVSKCDSCKDLRDKGENPTCVDACIMRCIEWGELDALKAKHKGETLVSEVAVLPSAQITTPSLLINAKSAALVRNSMVKEI
jgi:anaerobic dimethyl sulfoxide reductase subunit B (iron-sulfur subunit)